MICANGLYWQALLWPLFSFATIVLAQGATGCGNVMISSAADADAIRKACKTITGDLRFADFFAESISLDGIEVIEGDIWHEPEDPPACAMPAVHDRNEFPCNTTFTISSSTLREVKGSIYTWTFTGLEKLLLPSLVRAGRVSLNRLDYLRTLDLTNLHYVEDFELNAGSLEEFSLEELKEFTGPMNGHVNVVVGPKIENLDGLFKNNLDPWQGFGGGDSDSWMEGASGVHLNSISAPGLKSLTFGWQRIPSLWVTTTSEVSVMFGGTNSTEMEISGLSLGYGVVKVGRAKNVKTFKVRDLEVRNADKITQLDVPFDQLRSLVIANATELTTVVLPPQAEDWEDFDLAIYDCPNLNLSSEYTVLDGESKKTWYWPRSDWSALSISAKMTNEFFESFLAPPVPRVLNNFFVNDPTGNLDCTVFDKVQAESGNTTFPGRANYACYSRDENSSAGLMGSLGRGQLVLVGMVIIATMIL